jgi:O-antigen/teichoic acid export membrane protein
MLNNLRQSEYARNSFILIFGTGLAQVIPLLLQPVLRRIFSDEDFGVFAQFSSIVAVLSIVSNLRYSNSIVLPKEDKNALGILLGSILLNFLTSFFFLLCFFFFGHHIFEALGLSPELNKFVLVIPASLFLVATNISFNFWLTRKKKYLGMVYNKGVRRISEGGTQIISSTSFRSGGLIIGSLIGDFINLLMSIFQFKKSGGYFRGISKGTIKESLTAQNEFPKYSLLPALLDVISMHMPVLIISSFYSQSIVGQFDGSRQLLAIPLALISISLSQVLFQKIAELNSNQQPIYPIIRQNFIFLAILSVIGIAIILPFGTEIYTFVFGKNWVLAGEMSRILVISYAIRFLISPLSIAFIAIKRLKVSALWQILYFAAMLCLLMFRDCSIEDFLTYFVIIDVVAYAFYGLLIYLTVRYYDKRHMHQS